MKQYHYFSWFSVENGLLLWILIQAAGTRDVTIQVRFYEFFQLFFISIILLFFLFDN